MRRHYSRLDEQLASRFERSTVAPQPTRTQSVLEKLLFAVFALLVVLVGIALYTTYSPSHRSVPNRLAEGVKNDRVNIVLIGIGGDSHPGGGKDLADSIILASLKPSTREVAVISLPRDLWVPIGRYGTHRLNDAHAIGQESGYPGEGPGLLCDTVSQVVDQPVHAYVRIDFSAFEKIIDDLGGIDVDVPDGFYDFLFKDGFAKGPHHFDGKRALAYARYRYILGPEGDNFGREMRQQQVIAAVRDKLQHRSPQEALHLIQALSTLSNNTQTNLTTGQMISLYSTYHGIPPGAVRHVTLKPYMEIFQVTRLAEAGEAVRPRTGDDREVQRVVRDVFGPGPRAARQQTRGASVAMRNLPQSDL